VQSQDNVLRPGTDAELSSPDAQAGADVIPGISTLVRSESFLVHRIGHPIAGPDLTMMGMTAELEIYSGLFSLFQMVGLMVQENREK
jgi:hypothetical protein